MTTIEKCENCDGAGKLPGDEPGQELYCPECDGVGEVRRDIEPAFYSVAICLYDRAYGGPEEGGWYYSTYEPARQYAYKTKCFKDYQEATNYANELRDWIESEKLNYGRRHPNSVLSEGHYTSIVFEDKYPCDLPERRPHYE